MISSAIQRLLDLADESHQTAKVIMGGGFVRFAAAQSYYTMFYLAQAMLLSRGLTLVITHKSMGATQNSVWLKGKNTLPRISRIFADWL